MATFTDKLRGTFLRTIDGLPGHVFAETPVNLLGGNETLIYAFRFDVPEDHPFSGALIVRIFNKASTVAGQYLCEEAVHNTLAEEGYPVPRIFLASAESGLGGPWLIMERIPGNMLGGDAMELPWGIVKFPRLLHDLPRVLAELHRKLHQIDSEPMRAALEALSPGSNSHTPAGKLQRAIDLVSPNGIEARRAGELLQTQQPQVSHPVICHGDFHPLNVMVDQGNVTGVLDWGRICLADPEYDLAAAHLLLRASALNLPAWVTPLVNTLKRRMAETFLAVYAENYAIDRARLEFYCAQRAFEELVLRAEGHTPQMGQVGGWDFDTLVSTVYKQTGIELQPGSSRSMK